MPATGSMNAITKPSVKRSSGHSNKGLGKASRRTSERPGRLSTDLSPTRCVKRSSSCLSTISRANRFCKGPGRESVIVDKPLTKNIIRRFASAEEFMIISLVRMPPDGLAFKHQYKAGELATREYDFELEEAPLVNGRATRAGQDVRLRGEIKARISAPCDRWLS